MNTFRNIIASFTMLFCFFSSAVAGDLEAGMNFKLKQMDEMTWGVFAVPGAAILPSKKSTTGSGQVTVVAPIGFVYVGLENYGGTWIENARVDGPMEAPETSYISFGFVSDEPRIKYAAGKETLLFTFVVEDAAAKISLIDNENDPFLEPNTYGTNPGNDLGVIDFDRNGSLLVYNYSGNIDMDTISTKSIYANEKNDDGKEKSSSEYKAVFASEKIATPGQ